MKKNIASPTLPPPPLPEQIRRETSHSLAADLIERGLQGTLAGLNRILIQLKDSGLIEHTLESQFEELIRKSDDVAMEARTVFPECTKGGAQNLKERKCRTLADEVEFYRQEQFWSKRDRASLLKAEDLISAMFRVYQKAEWLMVQIDADQPDYRIAIRARAPKRTVNPYEDLFN